MSQNRSPAHGSKNEHTERPGKRLLDTLYRKIINPPADAQIEAAVRQHDALLPTLWLLGKTGAGKSSIVQKLTGQNQAQIGNGFAPCTQSASIYSHPTDTPVIRFLDTRGLSEAGYDPLPDLLESQRTSHALLAVMRVDDNEQSALLDALDTISETDPHMPLLLIHTALHEINNEAERKRAIATNQQQVERRLNRIIPSVAVDFTQPEDGLIPHDRGLSELRDAVVRMMPALHLLHANQQESDDEQQNFEKLRTQIYWYAGVAAASDTLPAIGLVSVPGIQGKMLHSLAQQYGIDWSKRNAAELLGALGTSFLYRYALSMGGRQLSKLIPVLGQTAGAAAAASISFGSTFALGRAACKYFYAKKQNISINPEDIRRSYQQALQACTENKKH